MAADLSLHDAVLDEAALRFAQGDAEGAAQALREALADPTLALAPALALHDALLDLYCATGDAARFEALALDGAQRFQSSPPAWCHLPQQWADRCAVARSPRHAVGSAWQAPAFLQATDLPPPGATASAEAPWVLDWSRFGQIDSTAIPALTDSLHRWADAPLALVLVGAEALDAWLTHSLQAPDAPAPLWRLQLAWLRLQGQAQAFESLALAYCQWFGQSPPAWVPPGCHVLPGVQVSPPVPAAAGDQPCLAGEVLGDALPQLAALAPPPLPLRLDCALLLRLDFAAAGALLNWAAQRQAAGQSVALLHLHRPLARLLQLLGVDAYATLHLRK